MQLKNSEHRSNRANSKFTNGPRRSPPTTCALYQLRLLVSAQVENHVRPRRATCQHHHRLGRQNTSAHSPAYSGDLCPSKWSLKASSCIFSATTRPDRTRPCGTWQTSNGPSPSAALTSDMAILDDHGQRRRRIAAVRCASPNWAVAIGPEAETASSCPKSKSCGTSVRRLMLKPKASREAFSSNRPERDDGALTWPWLRSGGCVHR
jgi:hypothetical protein